MESASNLYEYSIIGMSLNHVILHPDRAVFSSSRLWNTKILVYKDSWRHQRCFLGRDIQSHEIKDIARGRTWRHIIFVQMQCCGAHVMGDGGIVWTTHYLVVHRWTRVSYMWYWHWHGVSVWFPSWFIHVQSADIPPSTCIWWPLQGGQTKKKILTTCRLEPLPSWHYMWCNGIWVIIPADDNNASYPERPHHITCMCCLTWVCWPPQRRQILLLRPR